MILHLDGRELRRSDGRAAVFNVDGITVSASGDYVYWQALNGRTLYRLPTSILTDPTTPEAAIEGKIERVGSDRTQRRALDRCERQDLFHHVRRQLDQTARFGRTTAPGREGPTASLAGQLGEGADGSLYVTTSHIQDSPWFKSGAPNQVATELWLVPGALPVR